MTAFDVKRIEEDHCRERVPPVRMKIKLQNLSGRERWACPRSLGANQARRGQAHLPNPEVLFLELSSVSSRLRDVDLHEIKLCPLKDAGRSAGYDT